MQEMHLKYQKNDLYKSSIAESSMKVSFLTTFIALTPCITHADSKINIDVKAGLDAATLAHEFRENRYGFSGGAAGYLQWPIFERFTLAGQLELLYTPRGANVIFEGAKQGAVREHYLDLVAAVRPGVRLGPADVYLLLGGGLNFLTSANMESVTGSKQDITGDLRRTDVALLGGAGVALHLPSHGLGPLHLGSVFVEARHEIGLIDTSAGNGGFKNRTSSFLLGLSLVVGRPSGAAADPASAPPRGAGL